MPITLYHVSFNVDEPLYKKFIPRIPDNTINEEDTETARVCFRSDIGVRPQCGQLKPRMLKIQRFWAYILDF
ncbi:MULTISPECIES: hypothetical protein, partial [Blautia]|uniref:hypothetical protein n=1 Tax=Blautia TaxID=572511 RepID=UPI001A9B4220